MRRYLFLIVLTGCLPLLGLAAQAAEPGDLSGEREKKIGDFNEVTPELHLAVKKGLDFLALNVMNSPNGAIGEPYPTAITALTGIAFLAHGDTPSRGPYAKPLKRCLTYIMSMTKMEPPAGVIPENYIVGLIDTESKPEEHPIMYSHGYATLFLAEAYGTTKDPELRRKLRAAINLIERTQGPRGGWSYQPITQDRNDMSVGVCQTMALRAARNTGVSVSESVVEKAIGCAVRARSVKNVNPDTTLGFKYVSPGRMNAFGVDTGGGASFPVTCGTVALLYGLGVYENNGLADPEKNPGMLIEPALRFVMGHLNSAPTGIPGGGHSYYGVYYTAQALAQAGGEERWGVGFRKIRDGLLAMRNGKDHWEDGGEVNPFFRSAIACIVLQVPYQYLPIFER